MRWFASRPHQLDITETISDEIWDELTLEEQSFLYALERRQKLRSTHEEFLLDLKDVRQLWYLGELERRKRQT